MAVVVTRRQGSERPSAEHRVTDATNTTDTDADTVTSEMIFYVYVYILLFLPLYLLNDRFYEFYWNFYLTVMVSTLSMEPSRPRRAVACGRKSVISVSHVVVVVVSGVACATMHRSACSREKEQKRCLPFAFRPSVV